MVVQVCVIAAVNKIHRLKFERMTIVLFQRNQKSNALKKTYIEIITHIAK